ncbi:hypothetical protein [Paludisphaera mucosa]|uniref:Uncharacterized protein n=1 Tax=Paludisphaera mucosa TaxID=3030827 RepID=A0ABT6FJ91_9BACT|nr:hypothetical protein [Paludisphaera mucosa]MDG3007647.1 hypothetical protein [Paludisphaera mucosa]
MKQAQSYRSRPTFGSFRPSPAAAAWPGRARAEVYAPGNPILAVVGFLFSAAWWVVTLPFRLVFGMFSLLGRMTGVAVGFTLMVFGMALGAGPFFLVGIPIFLVGLLLTLRCLG